MHFLATYKRAIIKTTITLLVLFVLMVIGIFAYVSRHKKEMLLKIEQQFNASFYGSISVRDIEPDIWKQFPNVCFVLKDVCIRDTQWQIHHQDFLKVEKVFVKVKFLPLFWGKLSISKLILSNGKVHFFENEQNYSNKSIFEKQHANQPDKKHLMINQIVLENCTMLYEHYHRKKKFNFQIEKLTTNIKQKNETREFNSYGDIWIHECCFNTAKGSFFSEQKIRIDLDYQYSAHSKTLKFEQQHILLSDNIIDFNAFFYLKETEDSFKLELTSQNLNYKNAISCLTPKIKNRLDSFNLKANISLSLVLKGKMKNQPNPQIELNGTVQENEQETKFGTFTDCNYKFHYNNGLNIDSINSEHSTIKLSNVSATYKGVAIHTDSIIISNLKNPTLNTTIKAGFPVSKLNNIIGMKSFHFGQGTALVDLKYHGGLGKEGNIPTIIEGYFALKNSEIEYLPRQLAFKNCNLLVEFKNQNIELKQSYLSTVKSNFTVSALAKNFLNLYDVQPNLIKINATVNSSKIDLNEFQSFLHKRTNTSVVKTKNKNVLADKIDKAFEDLSTSINIEIKELEYKRFNAKNIKATINLLPDQITMQNVSLEHANGNINLNGELNQRDSNKTIFNIVSQIKNTGISQLLYSFGNFGQSTFLPENINGNISLTSNLNGQFNKNGQFIPKALNGFAAFEVTNGELLNFKPLEKMGRFAFRKKRLSNVHFGKLTNVFTINGDAISIPPMFINSDLISLQLKGIYNLGIGTDLQIEIPLFKLDKEELNAHPTNASKGFRLYVRARDNELGHLQYSWKLRNKEIAKARAERKRRKDTRKASRK